MKRAFGRKKTKLPHGPSLPAQRNSLLPKSPFTWSLTGQSPTKLKQQQQQQQQHQTQQQMPLSLSFADPDKNVIGSDSLKVSAAYSSLYGKALSPRLDRPSKSLDRPPPTSSTTAVALTTEFDQDLEHFAKDTESAEVRNEKCHEKSLERNAAGENHKPSEKWKKRQQAGTLTTAFDQDLGHFAKDTDSAGVRNQKNSEKILERNERLVKNPPTPSDQEKWEKRKKAGDLTTTFDSSFDEDSGHFAGFAKDTKSAEVRGKKINEHKLNRVLFNAQATPGEEARAEWEERQRTQNLVTAFDEDLGHFAKDTKSAKVRRSSINMHTSKQRRKHTLGGLVPK